MTDLIERIKGVIDEKQLSSAEFAQKINVNKATLSHVLSGRNNPSLDFVMKICTAFPDISPNDLLLPQGALSNFSHQKKNDRVENIDSSSLFMNGDIDKVLIFYKDRSFEEFKPRS